MLEYLEATAARVPEKIAFTDEETTLSFGRLLSQAQSLGTFLARRVGAVNVPAHILMSLIVEAFPIAVLSSCMAEISELRPLPWTIWRFINT